MDEIKITSNKSFGIVFFIVFLLIAMYPLINGDIVRYWSLIISLIFLILSFLNSNLLTPLNKIWIKIGNQLGKIISKFLIGFLFFCVVTPIGLIIRIFEKDLLNLKFNNDKSYWIEKTEPKRKMKNQF